MSIYGEVVTSGVETEVEEDRSGRRLFEGDIYEMTIKRAFVRPSAGGALGAFLRFESEDGRTHDETIYFTNKNKETFYTDKNGDKKALPGFLQVNTLAKVALGVENFMDIPLEEKLIEIWNKEANGEIPTKVPVPMELIGKKVNLGIQKVLDDKTKKNESTGKYEPTGETQEVNRINKFFTAGDVRLTAAEVAAKAEEEDYALTWLKNNEGKTIDITKKTKPGAGGANRGGASKSAGTGASLFGS